MSKNRDTIHTMNTDVSVFQSDSNEDYISLTDIAKFKNKEEPNEVLRNWLRSRNTLELLGKWEELYNPKLNTEHLSNLLSESGSNSFTLSPTRWIKLTNAIGIISQPGRYGGTYAHSDIAFDFASWISPEFRLYLIKDYQQLKQDSRSHLNLEWNMNRELTKINYKIHTDAIKENIVPETLSKQQAQYSYANEADRLNVALFGQTAKQWSSKHPSAHGNIRDHASLEQLTVLTNLESMNAELIRAKISNEERTVRLNEMAVRQLNTLLSNANSMEKLKELDQKTKRLN